MTGLTILQAAKKQQVDEKAATGPSVAERQAAAEAAVFGDGIGTTGRFRDGDFFLSAAQPSAAERFEEGEFSVRGGTSSLMDSAVLDLMADDQVRLSTFMLDFRTFDDG